MKHLLIFTHFCRSAAGSRFFSPACLLSLEIRQSECLLFEALLGRLFYNIFTTYLQHIIKTKTGDLSPVFLLSSNKQNIRNMRDTRNARDTHSACLQLPLSFCLIVSRASFRGVRSLEMHTPVSWSVFYPRHPNPFS